MKVACPKCKSEDTCRILYGMVDYDEEIERKEAAGQLCLGGCSVEYDDEGHTQTRHCNACDTDFASR